MRWTTRQGSEPMDYEILGPEEAAELATWWLQAFEHLHELI